MCYEELERYTVAHVYQVISGVFNVFELQIGRDEIFKDKIW